MGLLNNKNIKDLDTSDRFKEEATEAALWSSFLNGSYANYRIDKSLYTDLFKGYENILGAEIYANGCDHTYLDEEWDY